MVLRLFGKPVSIRSLKSIYGNGWGIILFYLHHGLKNETAGKHSQGNDFRAISKQFDDSTINGHIPNNIAMDPVCRKKCSD
jgi:hypothetical protein